MRFAATLLACCCALSGQTAERPTAAQLEAFEHFLKQPTAKVTWSKEVARIDSESAHAVVTALIVEDGKERKRGVRIDLAEGDRKDSVYAGEDLLARLIGALDEIGTGLPAWHAREGARGNGCFGSGAFWLQEGHTLSASQCVTQDWSGLSVGTGEGGRSFRFTGLDPAPFAAAVAKARDALKQQ
jgi:hypothetical protein